MKTLPFATLLAAILVVGCSSDKEVTYDNPPVGMLVSNDHTITIHTGPDGPLFSVKGPDGKQLATEISKEELHASFPDVNLNGLWAGQENGASGRSDLDATNYRILNESIQVVPKSAPR